MMLIAIIRVRGRVGLRPKIAHTLRLLNLPRVNNCVVRKDDASLRGMLRICKDYVTWGPISRETLCALIAKRGRLPGEKKIPSEQIESIAAAIERGEKTQMKRTFRLHPPRKGWKGIKRRYPRGALGPRPEQSMEELIRRMI